MLYRTLVSAISSYQFVSVFIIVNSIYFYLYLSNLIMFQMFQFFGSHSAKTQFFYFSPLPPCRTVFQF